MFNYRFFSFPEIVKKHYCFFHFEGESPNNTIIEIPNKLGKRKKRKIQNKITKARKKIQPASKTKDRNRLLKHRPIKAKKQNLKRSQTPKNRSLVPSLPELEIATDIPPSLEMYVTLKILISFLNFHLYYLTCDA